MCTWQQRITARYYHHVHTCGRAARSPQWLPVTELHAWDLLSTHSDRQHHAQPHRAVVAIDPPLPTKLRRTPLQASRKQPRRQPLSAAPKSDDLGITAPFTAQVESSSIRLRSSSPAPHRRPVGVTLHQHVACTREQRQGARGRQARFVAAVCACGRGLQGGWECHGWCCSKHTCSAIAAVD